MHTFRIIKYQSKVIILFLIHFNLIYNISNNNISDISVFSNFTTFTLLTSLYINIG